MITKSRPLRLLCDASTDGLGVTLDQKQPDGPICLIVYIGELLSDNEQNWTPIALEAGCVVWIIRRLRRYLFSAFFKMYANHECLQHISKNR